MARAIRENGRVILAGNRATDENETTGALGQWQEVPFPPFAEAAAGWGNANFLKDADGAIRISFPTVQDAASQTSVPWMPWVAAKFVGAPVTKLDPPPNPERWLNYYGPPGTLPWRSFSTVLTPGGLAPGFFKDKVVFIGAQFSADFRGKGKDEFATPYTRWDRKFAPGVEIHATAFLNLLHSDWLVRLPFGAELGLVFLCAAGIGFGLLRLRPMPATVATILAMLAIVVVVHALQWHGHIWFSWVALLLQLTLGLFCSVVHNSLKLYIEKKLIQESLEVRLSPAVAQSLFKDESLRRPGGHQQEVSILFSDIANFSRVSEIMNSDELINLLNRYYEAALKSVYETDGTVIDLIGDAIFAVWNAPIEQTDHRQRACLAALKLHEQIVIFDAQQRSLPLRTRVGLHCGTASVGNIGSKARFNYTAIGEDINLASRLEGLNKHLGTERAGHARNSARGRRQDPKPHDRSHQVQRLWPRGGSSRVDRHPRNRRRHPRLAREICRCLAGIPPAQLGFCRKRLPPYHRFAQGVQTSATGTVTTEKDDGPSHFYLARIAELRLNPPSDEWIGEVAFPKNDPSDRRETGDAGTS